MHRLAQSVFDHIRRHAFFQPGERVGAAVSGGADSVALLRLLLELKQELGIVLSVVHFNHQLRGGESDCDEQFVRDLAAERGLGMFVESRNVKSYAAETKLSLEAAGRDLRYAFFEGLLRSGQLSKIATGHTADDQAETVLLHLFRGSGLRGLAGIWPRIQVRDAGEKGCGEIVRPLLNTRRSELREFLEEIGQDWREDETNSDQNFSRNRLRAAVMPLLEKQFGPAIPEKLAELAVIARGEEEFWTNECARMLGQMVTIHASQPASLDSASVTSSQPPEAGDPSPSNQRGRAMADFAVDLKEFLALPLGAQRRLIHALQDFGMPLEFKHIDEALRLAREESVGREIQLPGGWRAVRTEDEFRFMKTGLRTEEQSPVAYEYPLPVPGAATAWEPGCRIETALVSKNRKEYNSENLLDARFTQGGLIIRNWRPGDRFWPAHSKQPKKIKELLQNRHVTGETKRRWPVIVAGDEVVWLRGFGVRRDFQAKNGIGVLIRDMQIEDGSPSREG